MDKRILVTGGAGFIGSNFVLECIRRGSVHLMNVDLLTYAGNLRNLDEVAASPRYSFVRADICDRTAMAGLLRSWRPDTIVHFAAESHVDRSIHGPEAFVQTNIVGTFRLLDETLSYWRQFDDGAKERFRFLHVSTDEVYGALDDEDPPFTEKTPYAPNSPYSASKAASDHLARAYHQTFGLPVIITNCSNNYGPRQHPEKLIPLTIHNAIRRKPIPVYGDGANVRDWIYVADHCKALLTILEKGCVGACYNIGGRSELSNMQVVQAVCATLDALQCNRSDFRHADLITLVPDRPGHDRRYAMDIRKISDEIEWEPRESFESGILKTVEWYLKNPSWLQAVVSREYQQWVDLNYARRAAA